MKKTYFTAESVTAGHPDKVADKIADAILDATLAIDPDAHTGIEVAVTTDFVLVMGEISASGYPDVEKIVRDTIREIGYDRDGEGFSADTVEIEVRLDRQSPDIAQGVNRSLEAESGDKYDLIGAGDQGMMFGFATNETESLMPMGIVLAHALTKRLEEARRDGSVPFLRPDGKAQVSLEYRDGKVNRIDCIVVSTQHEESADIETVRKAVKEQIIDRTVPQNLIDRETKVLINPTGRFVVGGPHGDSGLTGRKLIVDSYGSYSCHGGGATSGKDPSKVDRSSAYFARYAAKNIVAAGLADKVQLQVAYAIGKARPVSLEVNTFATGKVPDEKIAAAVAKVFDFRPAAVIEALGLKNPIYKATTNYGAFGKSDMPWERTDKTSELLKALNDGN